MKKFLSILICTLFMVSFVAAGDGNAVKVGVLKGPSGIPMARMMDSYPADYEAYASAATLLPELLKGEVDIGFLPPNVAAKVYNSASGAVVIAGVSGNGMLSLVTKDTKVKSLKDLKGKTVAVAGQGATPEYVTRFLLDHYGIENEVELDFSIPNAEIAPSLIAGKVDYAIVPEPFATVAVMKDASVRRAVDLQKEWKKVTGQKSYPMTVIAVNRDYAAANPDNVKDFVSSYTASQDWTVRNPEEAGILCEKYSLGLTASVVSKAVPFCAFCYSPASVSRKDIEALFRLFLDADEKSIGGKLPDDGFYFN